jgi:hypothetical protein
MAASPSSSPYPHREEDAAGAAVCCMCGDHGLQQELFRCKSCRVRLQRSYCSNLYPRATAYRCRCNGCLVREPPASGGGAAGHAATSARKRKAAAATASNEARHHHEGRSSSSLRRAPSELGCPVKKRVKVQRYKLLAEVISC